MDAKKCTNCGKSSHWFQDCWAPGGGAEGKGPKQSSSRSSRSKSKKKDRAHKAKSVASTRDDSDSHSDASSDESYLAIEARDLAFATASTPADSFYRDSGATCHITNDRHRIASFRNPLPGDYILAGNNKIWIKGYGSVYVEVKGPKGDRVLCLDNVAYDPQTPPQPAP